MTAPPRAAPHPAWPWVAVALLLGLPALAVGWVAWPWSQPAGAGAGPAALHLLWRRDGSGLHALTSLVSAAWVHGSAVHLAANLAGAVVVAFLGATLLQDRATARRAAGAWLLAWPLTHAGLWLDARLTLYAGASGVLHAGVAVLAFTALAWPSGPRGAVPRSSAGTTGLTGLTGLTGSTGSMGSMGSTDSTGSPGTAGRQRLIGALLLAGLLAKVISEAPWTAALIHRPGWDLPIAPLAHASGVAAGVLGAALCGLGRARP